MVAPNKAAANTRLHVELAILVKSIPLFPRALRRGMQGKHFGKRRACQHAIVTSID